MTELVQIPDISSSSIPTPPPSQIEISTLSKLEQMKSQGTQKDPIEISDPSESTPVASVDFTKFRELPVELRLRVWSLACYSPRNIELRSTFKRAEFNNTIFYTQTYLSGLTNLRPSSILQVCQESRMQALKHYTIEFEMAQPRMIDDTQVTVAHAGFYVNFACDTFIPTGHWNVVSMYDFLTERADDNVRSIAIDVTSDFYKEWMAHIKDYGWPFGAVSIITLYDTPDLPVFKRNWAGGKVEFGFEDVEEVSTALASGNERVTRLFAEYKRKGDNQLEILEAEAVKHEMYGVARGEENLVVEHFKAPDVRLRKLVVLS